MEIRSGSLTFTSKFDSGNLMRVERIVREDEVDGKMGSNSQEPRPDYEYQVWTRPDCHATEFENGNRSWFYFGIRGYIPNKIIKITIMNMNRQNRLYSQGHAPFYRISHPNRPSPPNWCRIRERPACETVDGQFLLTFTHRFGEPRGGTVYFAFCYPWSYAESLEQMELLDKEFEHCQKMNVTSINCLEDIYYHRELLCYSLDKLRVDLLTITDCCGMRNEREEKFDPRLFPDDMQPRPWKFKRKKIYLVSSRVHPGETPGSFVYNGFLKFILRRDDPRAIQLRRNFVFKLIPMLNPDGVAKGHYRTDSRGVNLNRVYLDPDFELHPTIYAAKAVLVYHHVANSFNRQEPPLSSRPTSKPCVPHVQKHGGRHVEEKQRVAREDSSIEEENVHLDESKNRIISIVHVDTPPPNLTSVSSPTPEPPPPPHHNRSAAASIADDAADISFLEATSVKEEGACGHRTQHTIIDQTRLSQELLWAPIANQPPPPPSPPPPPPPPPPVASPPAPPVASTPARKAAIVSMKFNKEDRGQPKPERRRFWSWAHRKAKQADHSDAKPSSPVLGNEGSDGESDDGVAAFNPAAPRSAHLCSPDLLEISPDESGVAFYIDLHGHCSKRGCFMYGNNLDSEDQMIENILFPKLIALNTAHFDFSACNFTVKNMYQRDKRDGLSKEGAGRVAIWKHLGLVHSYTLESNYNTGRTVNHIGPVAGNMDNGRATPPPLAGFPPKYTTQHYEEVGRAMAIAALDIFNLNPWSRINTSEHGGVSGIREWARKYLRGLRGGPRNSYLSYTNRFARTSNVSGSSTSSSQSVAGRNSCWPINATRTNPQSTSTTNTVYSRPTRPSLQGATGGAAPTSNNSGSTAGTAGPPSYRRSFPGNLRNQNSSSVNNGAGGFNHGGAAKATATTRTVPTKSERVGAIQRQRISHSLGVDSLSMSRDTRPTYAYKLDPACEQPSAPVAAAVLSSSNAPSVRSSLPGQPVVDSDPSPLDEASQQQQQAARVLMQMEMISCGAAVAPLRPRPFVRTRLSAGTRPSHHSGGVTTVGDSRLVVLPYDASTSAVTYCMSSPALPLVSNPVPSDSARQAAHYRPTAAASDPAIQSYVFDQKLLEDRKIEKLRSLKDSKRRRHELSFPPHRLGTLKVGPPGVNGACERRKSRRSMSFAGKSHTDAPPPASTSKYAAKTRYAKANRRRKTVGLHGKQAAYSEGDVGKDGAEDDDSSSNSDLDSMPRRTESPVTAFQSTPEEDTAKGSTTTSTQDDAVVTDANNISLKSQATILADNTLF